MIIFFLILLVAVSIVAAILAIVFAYNPTKWQMYRCDKFRLVFEGTKYGPGVERWTWELYAMCFQFRRSGPSYENEVLRSYSGSDSSEEMIEEIMEHLEDHTGHRFEVVKTNRKNTLEFHKLDKDMEELLS